MRAIEDAFGIAVRMHQAGDWQKAAVAYQEILRQEPKHAGASHLLGVAAHQAGDFRSAESLIRRAIELDRTKGVYWNNLGAAVREQGRPLDAEACFREALRIRPQYADALANLGTVCRELGRLDEAIPLLEQAIAIQPTHADALFNLAAARLQEGLASQAAELYRRAIAVRPQWAEAHNNLGNALIALRRPEQAVESYRRATHVTPSFADGHQNLGTAYLRLEMIDEARQSFRKASQLRPDRRLWAYRHLGLCPVVFQDTAEIDRYRLELETQLDACLANPPAAHWQDLLVEGFLPSFNLTHHGRGHRELKEKFARLFARYFPEPAKTVRNAKPKIGFVVSQHCEGGFLRAMGPIVEQLDPRRFDVVVLCSQGALATCRAGLKRENLTWVPLPDRFSEAVQRIRAAGCDLLYHRQIGTDPINYFLPFARLAPIQCTAWGTHGTSGIAAVDYFLSSRLSEPEGAQQQFTERLYLVDGLPEYARFPEQPTPATRNQFGLPEQGNLYLCPARIAKFHPDQDRLLREILEGDPEGYLVLIRGRYGQAADRLAERFQKTIPTLSNRILTLPWQEQVDYRRLLSLADVVLDTWHYSASLTAYDVFAQCQPLVTLPDDYHVGRYALGFYRRMGLEDLVTTSPAEYVSMALRLGKDRDYRQLVRTRIAERREVLFEDRTTVQEHERFFDEIVSTRT